MALYLAVKLYRWQDVAEMGGDYLKQEVGDRRPHLKDRWGSRPVAFMPVYDSVVDANRVTRETDHLVKQIAEVEDWGVDLL